MKECLITLSLCLCMAGLDGEVPRPRGVAISKASLYTPGKTFACLDGSAVLSYDKINDDYCDCADGSDEPGTAACHNGKFHCTNAGHKPLNIPSSRVNDGICDCCDGTDEYDSGTQCANTCSTKTKTLKKQKKAAKGKKQIAKSGKKAKTKSQTKQAREAGKAAREQREKDMIQMEAGHKIYLEYIQQAKSEKEEKQVRLEELRKEKEEVEDKKEELEAIKKDFEGPEKEAKEKHRKAWEEQKESRKAERDFLASQEAFKELDANSDGQVVVEEIQAHIEFDIDSNGEVSTEEATEYLEDTASVDLETFVERVWPNIKEIYKKPSSQEEAETGEEETAPTTPPPPRHLPRGDEDDEEGYDDEDDEEDADDVRDIEEEYDDDDDDDDYEDDDYHEVHKKRKLPVAGMAEEVGLPGENDDDKMPDYDEQTQKLIDAANKAREAYDEVEKRFRDIEREVNDLSKFLDVDLGENDVFLPLKGECYEYTDREYVYKLCPFEKATQRSKTGGSETSLGNWGHWESEGENTYAAMKYEKGQNCWNGPDRSAKVKLRCGTLNELVGASEPNRCEYQFEFNTPAVCNKPPSADKPDPHDEL